MNDFTKDELSWLWHEVTMIAMNHKHTHGMSLPIKNKIKSMIENYCKHECTGEVEIFVDVCRSCDALLVRDLNLRKMNE